MRTNLLNLGRSATIALSLLSLTAAPSSFNAPQSSALAHSAQGLTEDKTTRSSFAGQGSGLLLAMTGKGKKLGECPLKHTDVNVSVSGYVARVSVKQIFHNPYKDKIEAVYTFPLPENGAVDDMTMKVGKRIIRGTIKKREEAREIYETARASGHVASLLDQERPNIFTQSVANIEPGEQVEIEIKYVDLLPYESGSFSFAFPTVVGPRFNPGNPIGKQGTGRHPDTDVVGDASKITPQLAPRGERAGHDISISMDIDSGVPIQSLASKVHEINLERKGTTAHLSLANKSTIPNKDFVVTWEVASDELQSGYLTHNDGKSGYFTLMLLPPKRVTPETVAPKEMVFLIDCSGSQSGAPLDKAKETLNYIVDHMNPKDTFQIISFSDHLRQFADRPQKASPEMRQRAMKFIASLQANGGTWMAPAVEKVCSLPQDENRLRIVTFMTDGYVGNDFEILSLVKKYRGKSRWFPFGTGGSVNRFLIDGIAKEGGGEAEYVLLNSPGETVGRKFYERIKSPVLTDVKVDFGELKVKEVFPHEVSDVWAERPLYIKGRYLTPGAGTITLSGFAGGKPYKQELKVNFPERQKANEVIKPLWARAKVDRLMSEDWAGAQQGSVNAELKDEIVKTALDHHIMTQYTSFVAVEEKVVTKGGEVRTVAVPVELPEGLSPEAVYGVEGQGQPMPATMLQAFGGAGGSCGRAIACSPSKAMPGSRLRGSGNGNLASLPATLMAKCTPQAGNNQASFRKVQAEAKSNEKPRQPASKREADKKADSTLLAKLDPALVDLKSRLDKNPGLTIAGLDISNGKVLVTVSLARKDESVLNRLKALGFLPLITEGTKVTGRIGVEMLEQLALLAEVLKVEPASAPRRTK